MRRLVALTMVFAVAGLAGAATAGAADPVVMAAGDVACANKGITTPGACSHPYTSNLLLAQQRSAEGLAAVLAPGDLQYESGTLSGFRSYFGPSWGRLGSVLRPVPGNHEYQTSGAAGYYDYFAEIGAPTGKRGQGWYSFDVGGWHIIGLNSSNACSPVSCAAGSAQEVWLRNDLAQTTKACIMAFVHHPLASAPKLKPLWQALYDAGADFVLAGHTHTYKKPVARNPSGASDAKGPREVIVGTGGKSGGIYGALKLTLHPNSADWRFVGSGTSDSGSATCHGTPTPPPPATPVASFGYVSSGLGVIFGDQSTGSPTSWSWDFGDGATSTAQNPGHVYAAAGTYTVTLTARNAAGSDTTSRQVTVSQSTTPPPPPGTGATLVADTKANVSSPAKNYGTDPTLRVRADTYQSYLRFTVGGLSGPVTGATLRLQAVTQKSNDGGKVYLIGDKLADGITPWTETNVTWATMPVLGTRILGSAGAVDPAVNGGVVSIPLDPSAFTGDGTYDLGLASASTSSAYYSSREGGTAPQLLLTTG